MAEILEIIPEIDSPKNHINRHKMEDSDDWNILNILNTGTDIKINIGNIYKGDIFALGANEIVNRHHAAIKVTNCSNLQ